MPHIPRKTLRPSARQDIEPTERAPLASSNRKVPTMPSTDILELPMTLQPPDVEHRPVVPRTGAKPPTKRKIVEQVSARKWDKRPEEVAAMLGLDSGSMVHPGVDS